MINQPTAELKRIVEGAPEGAEFYGVIDPSTPFYSDGDPAQCERMWCEIEGGVYQLVDADMLCIYAFKAFHALSDISEIIALREESDRLKGRLELFEGIRSDSHGVAGYHLNGDVAAWEEFDL